jgi:signal transduction histidine kinase
MGPRRPGDLPDRTLLLEVSNEVTKVECDADDLENVLTVLIDNARDAIPKNGAVEIRASLCCDSDSNIQSAANEKVAISIKDSGCGVSAALLPHIFEPCFTRKKGKSGLSLCMAYNILKRHGGDLGVVSVPGLGSTFTVYLPCSPEGGAGEIANSGLP